MNKTTNAIKHNIKIGLVITPYLEYGYQGQQVELNNNCIITFLPCMNESFSSCNGFNTINHPIYIRPWHMNYILLASHPSNLETCLVDNISIKSSSTHSTRGGCQTSNLGVLSFFELTELLLTLWLVLLTFKLNLFN